MAEITKCIDINVPLEIVFDYVANPHNAIKYTPNFTKFEPVGSKERGLGAVVEAAGTFMGMGIKSTLEIVEFEENVKLVSRSIGGVKSTSKWYFKTLPQGGTQVTFISDYSLPGSKIGWLLDKMLVQKDVERTTIECLVNLKRLLEGKPNLRVATPAQW
ncbi:MAG: SRPBCC family protein [Chloroflexota bacterium]|nr:SRPBCC family protein [Chloroflexota bacterium]